MKHDPLQYVRDYYNVPAYTGMHVVVDGKKGIITGASGPHVMIKLEGAKHALPYHPTDGITYQPEGS